MKALLMHRDRDFDIDQQLVTNEPELMQDLELNTLLTAMADGDEYLLNVAHHALISGLDNDAHTILYRQAAIKDALANPEVVRELYALAVEAIEQKRKQRLGIFSRSPSGILNSAIGLIELFTGILRKLRDVAVEHSSEFSSEAFTALFTTLKQELTDDYLATIQDALKELRFRSGVVISAELGTGNEGKNYILRKPEARSFVQQIFGKHPRSYSFSIHPRDEAGGRALWELRDRGTNLAVNALAQSADHILSFFQMLRMELAFYVGVLNLYQRLAAIGVPICFPQPHPAGTRRRRFAGLYDVCLALHMNTRVVGNTVDASGKSLVMITGANQGGKSTFLRSIGVAQLMMQCGMFVGAESFEGELCTGLFTHYKREEDTTMKSGKFEEEIARMSVIADAITPNAMILFNESFAATNEREGSEIARQIITALLEKGITVYFVTHLYELAHGLFETRRDDTLFLRAERLPDGTRTFKLIPGEPLATSYGTDLYREIFGTTDNTAEPETEQANAVKQAVRTNGR